ncbi:MAG TPA: rhodanese-like domain-containing protein [Thermoanaerobaculia bacterium]|nr:rhodanese-like domain-containing protein [Thermoanaerobaculia bacterium]
MKKHLLEAVTLVAAAVICALVANALASNQRKLALVGDYPNALRVPAAQVATPAVPAPRTELAPPVTPTETADPAPAVTTTVATATQGTATQATAKPVGTAPKVAPAATAAPGIPIERFQPHPDRPYVEISYYDVAALHAAGALFLDARRTSVYEEGHIAGARPFSVWEGDIDQKIAALFEERSDPREQAEPIVVYCSGGACEDSHMLATKLWGVQFNNVYVYKDGFPDWQKRGGPVRSGPRP